MRVNDRYSRKILLRDIQEEGQEILSKSNVVVIGCGALGRTIIMGINNKKVAKSLYAKYIGF